MAKKWITDLFRAFMGKVWERFPDNAKDLSEDVMLFYTERPADITPAITFGLASYRMQVLEHEAEAAKAVEAPKPEVPPMKVGDIVEYEVDCDQHTPEFVARLRGFTGDYQGEQLTGRHYFKVQLTAAPRRFTNEESVAWAKEECGGVDMGVLPSQVSEDFRQKFPLVAKLGAVPFSGGCWWSPIGIFRLTVFLNWCGGRSFLDDDWCNPTDQWNVGNVFPVVLEHKKL